MHIGGHAQCLQSPPFLVECLKCLSLIIDCILLSHPNISSGLLTNINHYSERNQVEKKKAYPCKCILSLVKHQYHANVDTIMVYINLFWREYHNKRMPLTVVCLFAQLVNIGGQQIVNVHAHFVILRFTSCEVRNERQQLWYSYSLVPRLYFPAFFRSTTCEKKAGK